MQRNQRREAVLLQRWLQAVTATGTRTVALAAVIVAATAQACAATPAAMVGASNRSPGAPRLAQVRDAGVVPGAPSLPEDYRTKFAKLNHVRVVSAGHAAGRWEVDVWANELAAKALTAKSREVPVGAIVVQEHFEKSSKTQGVGPIMVMEKRAKGFAPSHGDWRYSVIASSGALVKDGPVESCAGCHDDSPMDGFFPFAD